MCVSMSICPANLLNRVSKMLPNHDEKINFGINFLKKLLKKLKYIRLNVKHSRYGFLKVLLFLQDHGNLRK